MVKPVMPYRHPLLGIVFDFGIVTLIHGVESTSEKSLAITWRPKARMRLKPRTVRIWSDEAPVYQWLRFNISLAGGWGVGLDYEKWDGITR